MESFFSNSGAEISVNVDPGSFLRNMQTLSRDMRTAVTHALSVVARELLQDARLYVPVLTGRLRDSGRVENMPTMSDAVVAFNVVYGGDQIDYAIRQHEVPFNHPSLGFFGPAQYLEKPLRQNYQFYLALFTVEVQIALARRYPNAIG